MLPSRVEMDVNLVRILPRSTGMEKGSEGNDLREVQDCFTTKATKESEALRTDWLQQSWTQFPVLSDLAASSIPFFASFVLFVVHCSRHSSVLNTIGKSLPTWKSKSILLQRSVRWRVLTDRAPRKA